MAPRTTGYSGTLTYPLPFRLQGFHLLRRCFPTASARVGDSVSEGPTTPPGQARRFRLFPFRSPLLRESLSLSSPLGTEMFQFPRFPPPIGGDPCSHGPGSPIRTSRDQRPLPAPPGLSQVATSFIGSGAKASTVGP